MNFISLVAHGLSSISVYVDIIFVRLLLCCVGVIGIGVLAIIVVVCYKLFTNLATPGWTTTLVGMFLIIMFQAGVFILGSALILLGNRSNYLTIPALDCDRFIHRTSERHFPDCEEVSSEKRINVYGQSSDQKHRTPQIGPGKTSHKLDNVDTSG
jgi:hypothetical protein